MIRRAALGLLVLLFVLGCSKPDTVTLRVRNLGQAPISNVELQYMGKSFGIATLGHAESRELRVEFQQDFQITAAFDDSDGTRKETQGPQIYKGDSGFVELQIADGRIVWVPQLKRRSD